MISPKEKERCTKRDGTGRVPQWPKPYTPLPANVISSIKENAPDCDECSGTGYTNER